MRTPRSVADFLAGRRFAVAGVSRDSRQPANAILRKLRDAGYEAVPVNPRADEVEGVRCHPDLESVPGSLDGLVIATPPAAAADLVRRAAARGIPRLWFHRSIGQGSVSPEAVQEARRLNLACIVGGCPLMYCDPVDPVHRCMRWLLRWGGRIPG